MFWPDGHSFSTERVDVSGFPHNDADLKMPLCTFTVGHHRASDETVDTETVPQRHRLRIHMRGDRGEAADRRFLVH